MRTTSICLALLVLFGATFRLAASIGPTFNMEASTWDATDIVLATKTAQTAGHAKVLEAWKGSLRPGETLDVPGLEAFASEDSRTVSDSFSFEKTTSYPPVRVTGSNLVLFLKRGEGPAPDWQPATLWKDLRVAIVWIEGGKTYTFLQMMRPGPTELHALSKSPADLKSAVDEILRAQTGLSEAARTQNPAQRAWALVPFVSSDVWQAREEAFREFGKCGDAALPVLRSMLADEKLRPRRREIIDAMGKAGGTGVGNELTQLLRRETAFWKRTAPSLQPGWWNGKGLADWSETDMLRERYGTTLAIIRALTQMGYRGDMEAVVELRDYWTSLPQLDDKSGLDQMSGECNQLLRSADAAGR